MASSKFGKEAKRHYSFHPEWRNLNNGSFGSVPREVKNKQIEYQTLEESFPDKYARYDYPKLLDASREAVAKLVNAPANSVVIAQNATTAFNIVLRNLEWNEDGKDEIISFSTIYAACGKTIDWVIDHSNLVSSRVIQLKYPLEDNEVVELFRKAVAASKAEGKRPRLAVFDTVTPQPAACFPYKEVTKVCRENGVLSLVDGAQGVGMIHLDLKALDADFFLSNLHKWAGVPRGCAFLYVAERNQSMMASTLPTSHSYVPKRVRSEVAPAAAPGNTQSVFVQDFRGSGTLDNSAFATIKDALEWRARELGTEDEILGYLHWLAKNGGKKAADVLGTEVLENAAGTLINSALVCVFLPIKTGGPDTAPSHANGLVVSEEDAPAAMQWALKVLVDDYKTFIPMGTHHGQWFVRLSAQVYLELEDFEWAGQTLQKVVERLRKQEYKNQS